MAVEPELLTHLHSIQCCYSGHVEVLKKKSLYIDRFNVRMIQRIVRR